MADRLIDRFPLSDLSLDEADALTKYKSLLSARRYSDAVASLDSDEVGNGMRAAVINTIKDDILNLEAALLEMERDNEYCYSDSEPSNEELDGRLYWMRQTGVSTDAFSNEVYRYAKYIALDDGFEKASEWQLADDVEFFDGETLEDKFGRVLALLAEILSFYDSELMQELIAICQ